MHKHSKRFGVQTTSLQLKDNFSQVESNILFLPLTGPISEGGEPSYYVPDPTKTINIS